MTFRVGEALRASRSAATADQTAPTAAKIANPKATQINMMGAVERKFLKNAVPAFPATTGVGAKARSRRPSVQTTTNNP
jgi:hypothetical protein